MNIVRTLDEIRAERPPLQLEAAIVAGLDRYIDAHGGTDEAYATAIELAEHIQAAKES